MRFSYNQTVTVHVHVHTVTVHVHIGLIQDFLGREKIDHAKHTAVCGGMLPQNILSILHVQYTVNYQYTVQYSIVQYSAVQYSTVL